MREELQDSIKRFMNFMNFTRSFFKRKNPFKALAVSLISSLKDIARGFYVSEGGVTVVPKNARLA